MSQIWLYCLYGQLHHLSILATLKEYTIWICLFVKKILL
jgi:hypothetical protein